MQNLSVDTSKGLLVICATALVGAYANCLARNLNNFRAGIMCVKSRLFKITGYAVACLAIVACGGGEKATNSLSDVSSNIDFSSASAQSTNTQSTDASKLRVESMTLQGSTRVSRTVWQYVYGVNILNAGRAVADGTIQLKSVGQGTKVVQGRIDTGPVPAGGTFSGGTITIQQDRTFPLATDGWTWSALALISSSISVDSSVPAVTNQRITKVVSAYDEKSLGQALLIPDRNDSGDSAILALDANGNILMGSLESKESIVLNAQSTAATLARLNLGLPSGANAAQVNQAISASANFGRLVAAVSAALNSGIVPLESTPVLEALALVVSEAAPVDNATVAAQSADDRRHILSLATPTVPSPLPYSFVVDSLRGRSISAVGTNTSGGLNIVNPTFIVFSTLTLDLAGQIVHPTPVTPGGFVLLPAASPWKSLILSPLPIPTPGTMSYYNVTVAANTGVARSTNIFQLGVDSLSLIMGMFPDAIFTKDCAVSAGKALMSNDNLAILGRQPTPAGFLNFWHSLSPLDTYAAITACMASPRERSSLFMLAARRAFVSFSRFIIPLPIKTIQTIASGVGLAAEFAQFVKEYDTSETRGVCISAGAIANCAASLAIGPSSPLVKVGSTTALSVSAKDILGHPTFTPGTLKWSSDNQSFATVDQTGNVTGLSTGTATISVQDLATGASGSVSVSVQAAADDVSLQIRESPVIIANTPDVDGEDGGPYCQSIAGFPRCGARVTYSVQLKCFLKARCPTEIRLHNFRQVNKVDGAITFDSGPRAYVFDLRNDINLKDWDNGYPLSFPLFSGDAGARGQFFMFMPSGLVSLRNISERKWVDFSGTIVFPDGTTVPFNISGQSYLSRLDSFDWQNVLYTEVTLH